MVNSADPEQTAPCRRSLTWVCTVCSDVPAQILKVFIAVRLIPPEATYLCKIDKEKLIMGKI